MSIYANAAANLRPKAVDLEPVLSAVQENSEKLTALLDALTDAPDIDLQPVLDAIKAIDIPEVDLTDLKVDLKPVLDALADLRTDQLTIENIRSTIEGATEELISGEDLDTLTQLVSAASAKLDSVKTTTSDTSDDVKEHLSGWKEFIGVLGNG